MSKKMLSVEELESQVALELPDREMMLVTVVITNLLNNNTVDIDVRNINAAVQVCAVVELINAALFDVNTLDCDIKQNAGGNGGGNGGGEG